MRAYITHISYLSLLILTMLLLLGLPTSAQRHSTRVRVSASRLIGIKNVDVVYISPAMLRSVPKVNLKIDGTESMTSIMDGVTSIHIYTTSDHKVIQEMRRIFTPVTELRRSDLGQLMCVKNDDGVVSLIGQIQGDSVSELYMFASGNDEYTVINFSGNFSRQ